MLASCNRQNVQNPELRLELSVSNCENVRGIYLSVMDDVEEEEKTVYDVDSAEKDFKLWVKVKSNPDAYPDSFDKLLNGFLFSFQKFLGFSCNNCTKHKKRSMRV